MKKTSQSKLRKVIAANILLLSAAAIAAPAQAATVEELEKRIEQLEKLLKQQVEAQTKQAGQIKDIAVTARKSAVVAASSQKKEDAGVTLYGSFRPALTYRDDSITDSTSTDITDFFSRVGIKTEIKVGEDTVAFVHGEWDIDIEGDADFGDARLGYAGLKGSWGQVAIGKQWNPHYNVVAEVTDIFNHRSSPFAYDMQGPFRTNNLVTYQSDFGNLNVQVGLQTNGDPESRNGGDQSQTLGRRHIDSGSIGAGYRGDGYYLGVSYLSQKGNLGFEREFLGIAGSLDVTDNLYAAFTYQDVDTSSNLLVNDLTGDSLDLAMSYAFGDRMKLKTSYFMFDDGIAGADSSEMDGYNITLEKQLKDNVRVFVELLSRDFDASDSINTLSTGIRYDFSTGI